MAKYLFATAKIRVYLQPNIFAVFLTWQKMKESANKKRQSIRLNLITTALMAARQNQLPHQSSKILARKLNYLVFAKSASDKVSVNIQLEKRSSSIFSTRISTSRNMRQQTEVN